jgi:arabinose-5-phosphate isomerase
METDIRERCATDGPLAEAREVLRIEAEGLLQLADRIEESFARVVELTLATTGRLIVSGIGKSGIVGRKIVATLNSTGTRALFLHPVEAMHGDLGMVGPDDVFLALSNSGETDELNILLPSIRAIGCRIVAFTGARRSTLARNSDIVIDTGVAREACPLGLAPTASTTALMAMGDALAVVLINRKQFKRSDFRKNHPGGSLGQRLSRRVRDIMLGAPAIPAVSGSATLVEAIACVDRGRLGVALILDESGRLAGVITDGDLRRLLARRVDIDTLHAADVMTRQPRTVGPDTPAYDALNLMERHLITVLPVVESSGRVAGVLHLHDILGKGAFTFNGN